MCWCIDQLLIAHFRVQTISDILSTQIKWNQSNDFTDEPIELMFEISQVN